MRKWVLSRCIFFWWESSHGRQPNGEISEPRGKVRSKFWTPNDVDGVSFCFVLLTNSHKKFGRRNKNIRSSDEAHEFGLVGVCKHV